MPATTPLVQTPVLLADLARALGSQPLEPADDGGVELLVNDDVSVLLYGLPGSPDSGGEKLLIIVPLLEMPEQPDPMVMGWLLRRNRYDSDLQPFVVTADDDNNLLLWARIPVSQLDGESLGGMIGALGDEARRIRDEMAMDAPAAAG